jgi:hypothetical protein
MTGALRGDSDDFAGRTASRRLRARGLEGFTPNPPTRSTPARTRAPARARPVGYDMEDYKNRNAIERCFVQLKNCRGTATRYKGTPWSVEAASSSSKSFSDGEPDFQARA